jgi:hypothetical protein
MAKKYLTSTTKRLTIRKLINNRSMFWSTEPEFGKLAELHGFAVKVPEIRFLPHNP